MTVGVESFLVKDVYWILDPTDTEIELRTEPTSTQTVTDDKSARERLTHLRGIGFDFGSPYPFEKLSDK